MDLMTSTIHHGPQLLRLSSSLQFPPVLCASSCLITFYCRYLHHEEEAASRHSKLLDARVRQEEDARKAVASMQASARDTKGGNDKVLKQARQKQEKMARIGLFREDGRRFKLQSLATLDDESVLLPDKVEAKRGARDDHFEFPDPNDGGALRTVAAPDSPLVEFRDAALGYSGANPVISHLTQHICMGSRIAVVGSNNSPPHHNRGNARGRRIRHARRRHTHCICQPALRFPPGRNAIFPCSAPAGHVLDI